MFKYKRVSEEEERETGNKYELLEKYKYQTEIITEENYNLPFVSLTKGKLILFEGFKWDGSSGPAIDDKTNMRGSAVHDAICRLMRRTSLSLKVRKKADILYRKLILRDGMNKIRAWWHYAGVRVFGRRYCKKVSE